MESDHDITPRNKSTQDDKIEISNTGSKQSGRYFIF
jgi:hypothetical protein